MIEIPVERKRTNYTKSQHKIFYKKEYEILT